MAGLWQGLWLLHVTRRAAVQSLKKDVDTAVEQAKLSAIPPTEHLYQNIYADGLGMTIRGLDSQHKIQL